MQHPKPTDILCMIAILLLAIVLRFTNLETNPGWYTDEGTHVEIANNLINGETQYLAITGSHLLFSRLPLFGRILAFVSQSNGADMMTLRQLTASFSIVSVGLVMFVTRSIFEDRWTPLVAGLSLAIYPDPSFSNANYVIEDNLWRNWAYFHLPELEEKRAIFSGWPVVFKSGEIVVYQNPQKD